MTGSIFSDSAVMVSNSVFHSVLTLEIITVSVGLIRFFWASAGLLRATNLLPKMVDASTVAFTFSGISGTYFC